MRFPLLFVLAACYCCATATESNAEASLENQAPPPLAAASEAPAVAVFSQNDPQWARVRLGNGTMAQQGCLVTSLAMALSTAGISVNPRELAGTLAEAGLIDRRGRFIWNLPATFPLGIAARVMLGRHDAVEQVRSKLQDGMLVLLRLNHSASGHRGEHWVLAVRCTGGDIVVADPKRGVGSLLGFYGRLGIREMVVLAPR